MQFSVHGSVAGVVFSADLEMALNCFLKMRRPLKSLEVSSRASQTSRLKVDGNCVWLLAVRYFYGPIY